jgi:hypothetical protein
MLIIMINGRYYPFPTLIAAILVYFAIQRLLSSLKYLRERRKLRKAAEAEKKAAELSYLTSPMETSEIRGGATPSGEQIVRLMQSEAAAKRSKNKGIQKMNSMFQKLEKKRTLMITFQLLLAAVTIDSSGVPTLFPVSPSIRVNIENPSAWMQSLLVLVATLGIIDIGTKAEPLHKKSALVLLCGILWRFANPESLKSGSSGDYFDYLPKCLETVVLDHNLDYPAKNFYLTKDRKLPILEPSDLMKPCTRIPGLDFDYDIIEDRYRLKPEDLSKMSNRYQERKLQLEERSENRIQTSAHLPSLEFDAEITKIGEVDVEKGKNGV